MSFHVPAEKFGGRMNMEHVISEAALLLPPLLSIYGNSPYVLYSCSPLAYGIICGYFAMQGLKGFNGDWLPAFPAHQSPAPIHLCHVPSHHRRRRRIPLIPRTLCLKLLSALGLLECHLDGLNVCRRLDSVVERFMAFNDAHLHWNMDFVFPH